MRIYIAASIHDAPRAKAFAGALEAFGHTISHRWFDEPLVECGDSMLTPEQRAAVKRACYIGVTTSDLFVMLLSDWEQRGSHTEFGIALANQIPARLVGSYEQIRESAMYEGEKASSCDVQALSDIGVAR
ncbi:hypothetical protein K0U83_25450 [bacterium]|nr:hypothetical protein [bacterium]